MIEYRWACIVYRNPYFFWKAKKKLPGNQVVLPEYYLLLPEYRQLKNPEGGGGGGGCCSRPTPSLVRIYMLVMSLLFKFHLTVNFQMSQIQLTYTIMQFLADINFMHGIHEKICKSDSLPLNHFHAIATHTCWMLSNEIERNTSLNINRKLIAESRKVFETRNIVLHTWDRLWVSWRWNKHFKTLKYMYYFVVWKYLDGTIHVLDLVSRTSAIYLADRNRDDCILCFCLFVCVCVCCMYTCMCMRVKSRLCSTLAHIVGSWE